MFLLVQSILEMLQKKTHNCIKTIEDVSPKSNNFPPIKGNAHGTRTPGRPRILSCRYLDKIVPSISDNQTFPKGSAKNRNILCIIVIQWPSITCP